MVGTVVVLYGPKAVGKSEIAAILRERQGLTHVDPDVLVLDLLAQGGGPDPELGWLPKVEGAVERALCTSAAVSVEATGAWDSDWQLTSDMEGRGHRVLTVWVSAPLEITLRRLAERTAPRVRVSEAEARAIWTAATDRAESHIFDLKVNTGAIGPEDLPRALAPLLSRLSVT